MHVISMHLKTENSHYTNNGVICHAKGYLFGASCTGNFN